MIPRRLLIAALFFAIGTAGPAPVLARDLYRWVQYVPGGIEARALTTGPACPAATIDGAPAPMTERSAPGENFPVRACSLPLPGAAKAVDVAGVPVQLPKSRADRLLLIGDTGCRLRGPHAQACHDLSQWPFRLVATMAAHFKPDLVIHLGDMHYRESPCPTGNRGCAGSPYGDTWDVWEEDFFAPGEALLNVAPWVMVRGNHEECHRGGVGWARTIDPHAYKKENGKDGCVGPQQPYTIDLEGLTLVVMDVSTADERLNAAQAAYYRPQFELAKAIPGPVWYLLHRPIRAAENMRRGVPDGDNKTLAEAIKGAVASNVQALVSSHHHVFGAMQYQGDLPLQIVSGHGGNDLSRDAPDPVAGIEINGEKIIGGISRPGVFGFAVLERDSSDQTGTRWSLTGYDVRGNPIGRCALDGRTLACD